MGNKEKGYTVTHWKARPGKAEELIKAYTEFAEWVVNELKDGTTGRLLQDSSDTDHFIGIGIWTDMENYQRMFVNERFKYYISQLTALVTEYEVPSIMREVVLVKEG